LVRGWPYALREALTNLVFNAVEAMPLGGTIRLAARHDRSDIILEVTDDGVGMSAEVRARLFEPFFTTKGEKGTGLGLAGVYGIVQRHDGRIDVLSEVGRGSTFRIALKATLDHAAPPPLPAAPREQEVTNLRILAVEDEPELRRMLTRMLAGLGHTAVEAASGEEALDFLATGEELDLVLTDLGLGAGMNGWELVEQVHRRRPNLEVVLATGWGAEIDPGEASVRGVSAVVAKPYSIQDLRRALNVHAVAV
jgi:CheY-like chemotaxis protein